MSLSPPHSARSPRGDQRHNTSLEEPSLGTENGSNNSQNLPTGTGSTNVETRDDNEASTASSQTLRRNPISPSPVRPGPTVMTPVGGATAGAASGQCDHVQTPQASITRVSQVPPPVVLFQNLTDAGISDDQVQALRTLLSNHALQIQKLRISGDHLDNLSNEIREVCEHASSVT